MEMILYICAPVITLIYKILDYSKLLDDWTQRNLQISGLKRLKTCTGYPMGWIFNELEDEIVFQALIKLIIKNSESEEFKSLIKGEIYPSLICIGGSPLELDGIDEKWKLKERFYYSSNHPVMVIFGVNRNGGAGKAEKVCTIGELEKWIEDRKRNWDFWIGSIAIGLLSIGLIIGRLSLLK